MSKNNTYPKKLKPGDKVAILSPSGGLPEIYPAVFDLGLHRLKDKFHLEPVEYPTTRMLKSSMEDRARDVHAAFRDPEIKAIICSIGGEDQIKLLKHLDTELLKAHPKLFLGYSDATNIEMFLYNLGVVCFYGGAIMTQFGMSGAMDDYTYRYLKKALFEQGETEIQPSPQYTDQGYDWSDPTNLEKFLPYFPNEGWKWINEGKIVEGIAWGGCLEIIDFHLRADRYVLPVDEYKGQVLFLETSEELPSDSYVYRVLMGMGERGLLEQFSAILIGRPKAWFFNQQLTQQEKEEYKKKQEEAIKKALQEYNPSAIAIFNLDFGHTDPQFLIPFGGKMKIDGVNKTIFVTY